jgi:hypothetical protein
MSIANYALKRNGDEEMPDEEEMDEEKGHKATRRHGSAAR